MNGQIVEIKGRNISMAYHPAAGEPRLGDSLLVSERERDGGKDLVIQVIGFDSATYPGDREALMAELLEQAIADRHDVVRGEPAMVDLKEIKIARCKIRKLVVAGEWLEWDGYVPSRNVEIAPIEGEELLAHVLPIHPAFPVALATRAGVSVTFDAPEFDKVNALVGVKGSGKSHAGKLLLHRLTSHSAPCWVYDMNREFVDLPGADVLRFGRNGNFQLRLEEVGFPFLMAIIDDINPMTDVSRGALEHAGPGFMEDERRRRGFASIEYLLQQAENGRFHSNDMVNQAIETRLRMVGRTGIFADDDKAETLADRFDRITDEGGFLVFDLAEVGSGRLHALTRGLNRRLDAICEQERQSGRGRYPFVFFEEAHFYTAPGEILNLITRGRHLGLTTFFITNTPGDLPEIIFRQLDNLIVTGLSHTADLRVIGRCSLSDEDTLQSLAIGLAPTQAMIVGRVTRGFPLVVDVEGLPEGWPATGATRTFWRAAG